MAVSVYFATNRKVTGGADPQIGEDFHPNLDELRFGKVTFTGKDLYKKDLAAFIGSGKITLAPEKLDKEDADRSRLGSKAIFDEVRAEMLKKGDALIFVHGYDHEFREAAGRAVQLQQWLAAGGKDMAMLFFTWPSAGAGVSRRTYADDRKRAECSGLALGRAVLKATDFIRNTQRDARCDGRIHLLCHSMGNWAMRGAVQGMRTFVGNNIPPLFDEVILTAADEDDDTLEAKHKVAPLLRGCRRLTVYYNHQDAALKASDYAMGNPDRLGRSGPRSAAGLPGKVAVVNVAPKVIWEAKGANAWTADPTGHQYFRNNPRVRQDMIDVLNGKLDEDLAGEKRRRKNDVGDYWRLE
ncbi:alpha/beta hydrolase [Pelagibius litoralis]|uniref:Alpha/beta hydrolase n=1 Tax=Pelagibius litoralis TaxID=374515 RepID=A0A967EW31_9PROT|nr:alpha/beta hydrolase [Pelagibius litoralis]NIA69124.1 alpha/beta hydrolase [Pelagibius litoralis]